MVVEIGLAIVGVLPAERLPIDEAPMWILLILPAQVTLLENSWRKTDPVKGTSTLFSSRVEDGHGISVRSRDV